MRFLIVILLPIALLGGCTTTREGVPTKAVERSSSAIDRASDAYFYAKLAIDVAIPFLPGDVVARIRLIELRIEAALLAARTAITLADQSRQLRQVDRALVDLSAASTPSAAAIGIDLHSIDARRLNVGTVTDIAE